MAPHPIRAMRGEFPVEGTGVGSRFGVLTIVTIPHFYVDNLNLWSYQHPISALGKKYSDYL
jgi:hypothetical protein